MRFHCYSGGSDYGAGDIGPFPAPPDLQPTATGTFQTGGAIGQTRRCRFALAWPPSTDCVEHSCVESRGPDLDVCLFDSSGHDLGCAASWDNNYELLDVSCPAASTVTWQIYGSSNVAHPSVPTGWAQMDTAE